MSLDVLYYQEYNIRMDTMLTKEAVNLLSAPGSPQQYTYTAAPSFMTKPTDVAPSVRNANKEYVRGVSDYMKAILTGYSGAASMLTKELVIPSSEVARRIWNIPKISINAFKDRKKHGGFKQAYKNHKYNTYRDIGIDSDKSDIMISDLHHNIASKLKPTHYIKRPQDAIMMPSTLGALTTTANVAAPFAAAGASGRVLNGLPTKIGHFAADTVLDVATTASLQHGVLKNLVRNTRPRRQNMTYQDVFYQQPPSLRQRPQAVFPRALPSPYQAYKFHTVNQEY